MTYPPPQQYGAYPPGYGPQPGGYGPGGYGPPPKSNRTRNLVIAVVAVLLVGAGIGIAIARSSGNESTGADAALRTWVRAFGAHDLGGVRSQICAKPALIALDSLTQSNIDRVSSATVTGTAAESGSVAAGRMSLTVSGIPATYVVGLRNEGARWCISSLEALGGASGSGPTGGASTASTASAGSSSASGASSSASGATALGEKYFAAVQAHSLSRVRSLYCRGAAFVTTQADLDSIDSARALGPATETGTVTSTQFGILESSKGSQGSAVRVKLTIEFADFDWCVATSQQA